MLLQSLERLLLKCADNHFQISLKFLHQSYKNSWKLALLITACYAMISLQIKYA